MQINLLLPVAYSYLCHAEFPSGQTTFRQIGPTRFQFDRPSLPTNRTTSTHYGIPLPPRRTRSHTGRSQLPHRRIGGAGRTFPRTGFPDRTDDRSRRHLDARTGREFPFGPRRAGRHGRGQRRGIEHRQHPAHPGALLHRRPAHAGRHRRRDAGCRRPQFAAPLRSRLHLPPPCARPLGRGALYGAYLWWLLAK